MSSPERATWATRARSLAKALADWDTLIVAGLLVALAYALYETAWWRMRHDLPMMMYQAYLMNEVGWVPYRDFFDMNMPGTYATYRFIGLVFGYDDHAVRFADWTWLGLLWVGTIGFLRGLPWRPVVAGLALFSLAYLRLGGVLTLQREFLALPILAFGMWGATRSVAPRWRALPAGLAFGLVATYKPHLVIGVVVPAVYLAREVALAAPPERRTREVAAVLGWGALGVLLPAAAVAAWLSWRGLWEPFLHSLGYLPYYGRLDEMHNAVLPQERPAYLASETLDQGGFTPLFLAGGFGVYLARTLDGSERPVVQRAHILVALACVYMIYPAGSGQFWGYHWLPMVYFCALGAGLLLTQGAPVASRLGRALPRVLLVLLSLQTMDAGNAQHAYRARPLWVPSEGRPDRIARFLRRTLEPGDVVQPFDWVSGGVVHGMLLSRAKPATPYLYTFHFYHHVSSRYIQEIQRDFVRRLQAEPPAFVIESHAMWPWIQGEDTTETFPAYDTWLEQNYVLAATGRHLEIWERADHMAARGGTPVEAEPEECPPCAGSTEDEEPPASPED